MSLVELLLLLYAIGQSIHHRMDTSTTITARPVKARWIFLFMPYPEGPISFQFYYCSGRNRKSWRNMSNSSRSRLTYMLKCSLTHLDQQCNRLLRCKSSFKVNSRHRYTTKPNHTSRYLSLWSVLFFPYICVEIWNGSALLESQFLPSISIFSTRILDFLQNKALRWYW